MAIELYFLRHGLAGRYGDPKYKDDSLRPLTDEGRKKMRAIARGMKALGLKFDVLLCSPYLRALQTAQIVARAYKIKNKKICLTENLLPPTSIKELLKEVHEIGDSALFSKNRALSPIKSVLFIGHEPHLTQMISQLLKCDKPLGIALKKGGLCSLTIQQPLGRQGAVFNWLLTPDQLDMLDPTF